MGLQSCNATPSCSCQRLLGFEGIEEKRLRQEIVAVTGLLLRMVWLGWLCNLMICKTHVAQHWMDVQAGRSFIKLQLSGTFWGPPPAQNASEKGQE